MPEVCAEVELLVQDASVDVSPDASRDGRGFRETKELMLPPDRQDRFLDGPACRRIAVVDFDPGTGAPLPPPAAFLPRDADHPLQGRYADDGDPTSAATIAVNAFGTVFQTVRMFEGRDALGRQVRWAFDGEQLLVVPRAGEWANAFYDRATRSLQFFWFSSTSGTTVYTALSRDIVAHECGHALLDAVVPSLFDCVTPESIAIHEAVADVIALLMALDSKALRMAVLERSGNALDGPNAFNGIAEEFGLARPGAGGMKRRALRDLDSTQTLADLTGARPHVLSTLLSAVFYGTLRDIFAAHLDGCRERFPGRPEAAANAALGTAHVIFRRLVLRGIDYLPPGELTFADVGRATLAADRAARADRDANERLLRVRHTFAQGFVDRGLAGSGEDLDTAVPPGLAVVPEALPDLRDSDFVAYDFVARHRKRLGIPAGVRFTVLPRVDATKVIGPEKDGVAPTQRELILKVAWDHEEESAVSVGGARRRRVATGVTFALRWDDGRCLALVSSDVTARRHRAQRDELVRQLADDGLLDGPEEGGLGVRVAGGVATVSGTQRLLHLAGWDA